MGMKPRLATVAKQRGHIALLVFRDATRDNIIDLVEQRAIGDAIDDWFDATDATDTAGGFAHAVECGVGSLDPRYFAARLAEYRAAVDEVEPLGVA